MLTTMLAAATAFAAPTKNASLPHLIFAMIDDDVSYTLDFCEFVTNTWNYCTLNHDGLVMFSFSLYDNDYSGLLDGNELEDMIREVYGNKLSTDCARCVDIVKDMDKDQSGDVNIREFTDSVKKYPLLLFPAFNMQSRLKERTFGPGFWDSERKRRRVIFGKRAGCPWNAHMLCTSLVSPSSV